MTTMTSQNEKGSELAILDLYKKNQGDAKLSALREASIRRFEALGFPHRKHEMYTFVNTTGLASTAFSLSETAEASAELIENNIYPASKDSCLVFVNGAYSAKLSKVEGLKGSVQITPLSEAADRAEIMDRLIKIAGEENDVFAAINGGLCRDGILIEVAPQAKVKSPVQILFVSQGGKSPVMHCPRIVALAGKLSEMDLCVKYVGAGDNYFVNAKQDLFLEEGARIRHSQFQNDATNAWHCSKLRVTLDRNSSFESTSAASGSRLARCHFEIWLNEEGAEMKLNHIGVLHGEEQAHYYLNVHHKAPHTTSDQFFRNIVDGKSRTSFDGTVTVHPGAQLTQSDQLVNNLMLSDECHADNKPNLMIYADDVKCTHGATIGQVNEDQIFYLKTRGLSDAAARILLTRSFAESVIQQNPFPESTEEWRKILLTKLEGSHE
ncbi:MAG: Fe-S cluster assembly protein SufD [Candidatus Nitrohelix vancouverensis]|uniref:Fe-S cluster assembly protein SufD n=1 Tax=Candidatus Nitrohelix vancouverensis TaxID=2705534 RepID=A0A7T0G4I5_9BACT|nr:MAG: Fe-S cluster assembly protein SufD [Candidatus Nitrohelix vancouverensis]